MELRQEAGGPTWGGAVDGLPRLELEALSGLDVGNEAGGDESAVVHLVQGFVAVHAEDDAPA